MASLFQRFFSNLFGKAGADPFRELSSEESIPPETANNYSAIVSRVLPYFNQLNESNKQKFLKRVYNFKKSKSFHFHGLDPQEGIMILVSAASIQISFGLKNYLLPFFKEVYILSDAYQALEGKELYIGHVSATGIYISWKHFVQGFADYSDGVNVALHEMAHALYHENFRKETGIDWDFRNDFDKLPAIFGPIMTQVIVQRKSYLRGYAFTNFQEFWAVSVEYFFENSQGLKDNLPQLYRILCTTLKQDPLHLDELVIVD